MGLLNRPAAHVCASSRAPDRLDGALLRLQALASATDLHFHTYYRPVLENLRARAVERAVITVDAQTWFDHRLHQAEQALHQRKGIFLPPGAAPERIAQEADLWTYAVFTAALYQDLGTGVARMVDIAQLLPAPGAAWLWSNPEVLQAWLDCLAAAPAGPLKELIR